MKITQTRKTIDMKHFSHDIFPHMGEKRDINQLAQDFLDLWEDHLRAQAQVLEAGKNHVPRKKD